MPVNLSINDLNSAEHSQEPESLEPENLNGLDLIVKNNQNLTKPNVVKKIVGPYKGFVFKGVGDVTSYTKQPNSPNDGGIFDFNFLGADKLVKHRIFIPLIHSSKSGPLKTATNNFTIWDNIPASVAQQFDEFLAQSSDVQEVPPGTQVWCNYLDRENFKDPIYLGPIDDKAGLPIGSAPSTGAGTSLAGTAGKGDPFGGVSYKNASGQVSYPIITGSWTGELPKDGFTATTATVEDLIKVARSQIGKKEIPLGSNAGPEVDVYNGGRAESWSAYGISWCFRQIGAPLPADKIPYSGANGYNPAASIDSNYGVLLWAEKFGVWFQDPKPGDIVVYNTSEDVNLVNSNKHVGLVVDVTGDTMETIEFNWGDYCTLVKQNWKTGEIINKDGSRQKKYIRLGYARRPLPYSGVPGGQLVQAPVQTTIDSVGGPPGMYEVVTNGRSEGLIEMVNVQGTNLLYPKKYIRALENMRQAYKQATGLTLGVVSAYRDVALQRQLYSAYLARNKAPPQVAPPGFSLHNNGRAVDLATGQPHNGNYERDFGPRPVKAVVEALVKSGNYGPVAKWLVENSRRFGYEWAGYSFRELWHYELDVNLARSLGLIDE